MSNFSFIFPIFHLALVLVLMPLSLFLVSSQIILGDVNVSILNRNDKVRYKDDYEKFKLILNVIGLIMAFFNLIFNYR